MAGQGSETRVKAAWLSDLESRARAKIGSFEPTGNESDSVLYELRLHRLELEMQNEELRRNQRELERSRDYFRSLLAVAPLVFLALDCKGRIRDLSPAAARLLGHPVRELLDTHLQGYMQEGDADALHRHLAACLSTSTAQAFQASILSKGPTSPRVQVQLVDALDLPLDAESECWVFMSVVSEQVDTEKHHAARGEQPVVLLVDDEAALRRTLRTILASAGYEVIAVASGAEALEIARREEQRIDLLLTDVCMPSMDGGELGRRMASLRPEVRRLYISGDVGAVELEEGALLLDKPFVVDTLLDCIAKRLS